MNQKHFMPKWPKMDIIRGSYDPKEYLFNMTVKADYMFHENPKDFDVDFSGGTWGKYLILSANREVCTGGLDWGDVWLDIVKYAKMQVFSPRAQLGYNTEDDWNLALIGRGHFQIVVGNTSFRYSGRKGWEVV